MKFICTISLAALTLLLLAGCTAQPQVRVDLAASAPKTNKVHLNMETDPDLIVLDIKLALEHEGLDTVVTTAEEQVRVPRSDGSTVTPSDIPTSEVPYELTVYYLRGGYPYRISWRSILRDRETAEIIGTYKYDFNAAVQSFGWSNEKILEDMMNQLVIPFWK